jgi:hypothetical protein
VIRAKVRTRIKVKKKACKECKTMFLPKTSFETWCSPECGFKLAMKKQEAKKKKELKVWNKEYREKKEADKKKPAFEKDLQDEVNHIVRLIDKGHECISSNVKNYQVNAGHLYSTGAFPALRFHLLNIYAQSVHDNLHEHGNGVIYKERIKEVFGQEVSEEIETLKARYKELKLSIPELKETIKVARKCVRDLVAATKDNDKPFDTEQRIELRRYYNQILNIYL